MSRKRKGSQSAPAVHRFTRKSQQMYDRHTICISSCIGQTLIWANQKPTHKCNAEKNVSVVEEDGRRAKGSTQCFVHRNDIVWAIDCGPVVAGMATQLHRVQPSAG